MEIEIGNKNGKLLDVCASKNDRPICLFGKVKIILEHSRVVGSRLIILGCDFIDERTEE